MAILAAAFNQGGPGPTINVVNKSTVKNAGMPFTIAQWIAANQNFLDTIFVPVWGYGAKLPAANDVVAGGGRRVCFAAAAVGGALGYHDKTSGGQPIGKVFVKTTLSDKEKVSVTANHEL